MKNAPKGRRSGIPPGFGLPAWAWVGLALLSGPASASPLPPLFQTLVWDAPPGSPLPAFSHLGTRLALQRGGNALLAVPVTNGARAGFVFDGEAGWEGVTWEGSPAENHGTAVGSDTLGIAFSFDEPGASDSIYLHTASGAVTPPVLAGAPPRPSAIAKQGGRLAVARSNFPVGNGSVQIFEEDPTSGDFEPVATFVGSTGSALGTSLALDGPILVAGAPGEGNCGAVHVYVRLDTTASEGVTWVELQTIDCPSSQLDAEFGRAVALSGSLLVVGAPRLDRPNPGGGPDFGGVYLFRPSGLLFELDTFLRPLDVEALDQFGFSVALFSPPGSISAALVAGAPGTDGVGGFNAGAAYLFLDWGDAWRSAGRFTRLTEGGVEAGVSVAIGAMGIVVGASGYDGNSVDEQGAVFAWNGVVPLFWDGFDRGDDSAWSAAVP